MIRHLLVEHNISPDSSSNQSTPFLSAASLSQEQNNKDAMKTFEENLIQ
jgi:hypothetical protein